MWYVERLLDNKIERWEGLTKEQAQWVYMNKMYGEVEMGEMR